MPTVVYAYVSLIKVIELFSYIIGGINGVILNVVISIGVDATIGGIE